MKSDQPGAAGSNAASSPFLRMLVEVFLNGGQVPTRTAGHGAERGSGAQADRVT